ncbi:MAG: hypothetical protein ACTSYS_12255 [Promethearchaeota archaeon]
MKAVKYHEDYDSGGLTLEALLKKFQKKVRLLGQECLLYIRELKRKTSKIAFGTGAINNYRFMINLGAGILMLTDDGTFLWNYGQWAKNSGKSIIVVNNATAEEPGMITLSTFMKKNFSNIPIHVIRHGCLYNAFTGMESK